MKSLMHPAPALLFAAMFSIPAPAQSSDDLFREGVSLYLQNRPEEALQKFSEVLAANPSNEDAFRFYENAGREALMLMLTQGGEYETTAKRFLELGRLARKEKTNDPDVISGLVELVLTGNYLDQRDAVYALSGDHGEYGAAALVGYLGDEENEEARVRAITALVRMASDAVLPVVAALDSGNERMIWNAVSVLGAIGDSRALPWVKGVHETTDSQNVRAAAEKALHLLTGESAAAVASSTDLHIGAAVLYFNDDDAVTRPFETPDAIWSWDDGVQATPVPAVLRSLKLAEQHCFAALHNERAQAILSATLAAQKAAVMNGGDDADATAEELVKNAVVSLASAGPDVLSAALRFSLAESAPDASLVLIEALKNAGSTSAALVEAFQSPYKIVAYHAAFALAHNGQTTPEVVAVLTSALGEDAIRTVLVVDDQPDSRNAILSALRGAGNAVISADSGALGFARSRSAPVKDLVIVRAGLRDTTVDRFVFDGDFRAEASPVLLLAGAEQADEISSTWEGKGKVAGILAEPITPETLVEAVNAAFGEMNDQRAQALAAAETAAMILAHLSPQNLATATDALVAALGRDEQTVLVPVLGALGKVGGHAAAQAALPLVAAIVADSDRSEEVRIAACGALSGIFAATAENPGDDVVAPVRDAALSDSSEGVRVAAGQALGRAAFLNEEQRAEILRSLK